MVVARYTHGQLVILDRLREMVRLGRGPRGRRPPEQGRGRTRAGLPRAIRPAAARHAPRQRARGRHQRLATRASARKPSSSAPARPSAIPIEIVSGIEEARLIYSGVSHTMPAGPGRRLVCDIGGGSTEIIIGEGLEPLELESLQMGCVRLSEEFFADGRLSQKRMQRARVAARQAIEPYQAAFRRRGWDEAVGSSGTVRAIGDSIRELDPAAIDIGADGLERIIHELGEIEHIRDLKLNALTDDRKLSFAGGVAILAEVFEQLGIESMKVADGAMREGLLYDLRRPLHRRGCARAHRAQHAGALSRRPRAGGTRRSHRGGIPRAGGGGVVARRSGDRAAAALGRAPARDRPRRRAQRLSPPRRLSTGQCRHGRASRAKSRNCSPSWSAATGASPRSRRRTSSMPPWDKRAPAMTLLLRLAVLLHRGRSSVALPEIRLTPRADSLELRFPAGLARRSPA